MTDTLHRAKPGDLCMGDSFQRDYQYRTTWPLAECLHDKFFLPLRQSLVVGDQIRFCRFDGMNPAMSGINLLETALVIVCSAGRERDTVPIALLGDIMIIGEKQPAASPYRVDPAKAGKAKLMKGETLVQEYGSKSEADEAMKKLTLMDA